MNKIQMFFWGISIVIISLACDSKLNGRNNKFTQMSLDTIPPVIPKLSSELCSVFTNTYFKRFGIIISSYYIVRDSLSIDLNNDYLIDTIIILSPISLEPIDENYNCDFEQQPKRLLVEIINNNGKSKIRNIYMNLISDIGGVLSHYSGIFKTNDGFKVVHQAGAKYSWVYTIEFSNSNNDKITLLRISKICSYDGIEIKQDYKYKNQAIEKINVSDSLKINCNCDEIWLKLEK